MLLTITTTHQPASDLSYLLHKHPERFQSFDLSFGRAHVFYPEVSAERCTACLLLDVDPVAMVRGKNANASFLLAQYVNDRPWEEYERPSANSVTGERVVARRKRIRRNLELPMKDDYSAFLRKLITDAEGSVPS
jgi:hypothetical protein